VPLAREHRHVVAAIMSPWNMASVYRRAAMRIAHCLVLPARTALQLHHALHGCTGQRHHLFRCGTVSHTRLMRGHYLQRACLLCNLVSMALSRHRRRSRACGDRRCCARSCRGHGDVSTAGRRRWRAAPAAAKNNGGGNMFSPRSNMLRETVASAMLHMCGRLHCAHRRPRA